MRNQTRTEPCSVGHGQQALVSTARLLHHRRTARRLLPHVQQQHRLCNLAATSTEATTSDDVARAGTQHPDAASVQQQLTGRQDGARTLASPPQPAHAHASVAPGSSRNSSSASIGDGGEGGYGPFGGLAGLAARVQHAAAAPVLGSQRPPPRLTAPELLPEKDFGCLRGGQYPFLYDPVYGLPVVRDVVKYGEVLRDVRQGQVKQILWFFDPAALDPFFVDGRCLVHYRDGRVAQSVVPKDNARVLYAMEAHGVQAVKLPLEPRHVVEYAAWDDPAALHPLQRAVAQALPRLEADDPSTRRGPRVGPTKDEAFLAADPQTREAGLSAQQVAVQEVAADLERMDTEDWNEYRGAGRAAAGRIAEERAAWDREAVRAAASEPKAGWADRIIISQDMQALIYKYIPIIGPVAGSAFILGLYVLARLLRGDLTDRLKMMDSEEEKRRRQVLREARIAFLEEEVPALVAKGASEAAIRKRCTEVNKKLGDKFEITESELSGTVEACARLLKEGANLEGGAGSSSAASRILAEQEALERQEAQDAVQNEGGGGGEAAEAAALMEMGKLATARVRKAIDPRILEVKKKVRAARRKLKRESKVQISDEIIFFDDVAGNDDAKVALMEVVDFFRQPEKFRKSGAKPPKGVLLVGPPGNGKTLMARAVAGESGVAFISSSASEFIEMYMGLGAARVRDLFNTARGLAPCVIFIDELDAVGRARRSGGGGNDERDNTVNQLLTEMDGFEAEGSGIVVMGATNRKDVLDAALTRPGRFDRSIEVTRPDYKGRLECITVHLRDKPLDENLDYAQLAVLTGGMSGAQIGGVCNAACFLANREGHETVRQEDLVRAIDQSKYGRSHETNRFVSPARRRRFAIMEAGIALVATLLPAIEPVSSVTIQPSAKSPLGRTMLKPNISRYTTGVWTRTYLEQQLLVALAGRAAEEVLLGVEELSSLNQHRIMLARQVVHKMLNAGFSRHPDFEHIRSLGHNYMDPSFEPQRWTQTTITTDANQSRSEWVDVDMEMEGLLNDGYAEVKALLSRNRAALEALVEELLSKELLSGDEVRVLVEQHAQPGDLQRRSEAKELAFM